VPLLKTSRRSFPFAETAFSDAAYAAERVKMATGIAIEMVRKPAWQVGFCVHKRRWVVKRCFAWLGRNRRLAKEFEATTASITAFLYAASAMLLVMRLALSE
jgi:transposase